ncbi:MAG: hypothetical protein Q7S98_00555 [Deltaproteobacteria bacterium]|nr:hypothetical protein [Deltaproteobacteria bacterium]
MGARIPDPKPKIEPPKQNLGNRGEFVASLAPVVVPDFSIPPESGLDTSSPAAERERKEGERVQAEYDQFIATERSNRDSGVAGRSSVSRNHTNAETRLAALIQNRGSTPKALNNNPELPRYVVQAPETRPAPTAPVTVHKTQTEPRGLFGTLFGSLRKFVAGQPKTPHGSPEESSPQEMASSRQPAGTGTARSPHRPTQVVARSGVPTTEASSGLREGGECTILSCSESEAPHVTQHENARSAVVTLALLTDSKSKAGRTLLQDAGPAPKTLAQIRTGGSDKGAPPKGRTARGVAAPNGERGKSTEETSLEEAVALGSRSSELDFA